MNWVIKGAATLAFAALAFGSDVSKSPNFKGKFSLPYEVHWGAAVLPPGDYTIANSDPVRPGFMYVRTHGSTYMLLAGPTQDFSGSGSRLALENINGMRFVTRLDIASAGTAYTFKIPKAFRKQTLEVKSRVETLGVMDSK